MDTFTESLAAWASIAGSILGILGLIQSYRWLVTIGGLLFIASVWTLIYAKRQREILGSAEIKVEARSIDSLNIANLRRRLNRTLVIQEAHHVAEIWGENLTSNWRYAGYCTAIRESAIEFSVDTDNNIPFDELRCHAYDVRRDPEKAHRIYPILLGADGISKKVAVPFLESLVAQEPFNMLLECDLPGCMRGGVEYYTSTLSFDQNSVRRFSTRLVFRQARPLWVPRKMAHRKNQ